MKYDNELSRQYQYAHLCGKCGATRIDAQMGLEPSPDAYVQHMVQVFCEVWRVLRDDGVCWLNLGDSYSSGSGQRVRNNSGGFGGSDGGRTQSATRANPGRPQYGDKPKDMVGIPWRVAFALQADGWYLRSDVIWSKPNPMPESVQDRPTKSHEYVFLLTKSARYYFDADAVREANDPKNIVHHDRYSSLSIIGKGRNPNRNDGGGTVQGGVGYNPAGRNIRSVWHIATQPYPGAHFATMPEKLVERCVLAGSRSGDVVLDPFLGSGTVALVALRLGRRAIGCDLNPAYLSLVEARTRVTYGLPFDDGDGPVALAEVEATNGNLVYDGDLTESEGV